MSPRDAIWEVGENDIITDGPAENTLTRDDFGIAELPERVRLATLDDLQDLPLVCMVGFSHSPVFKMQRPYYPKYPGHTLNYFELQIIKAFLSGATIFISEDSYDSSEEEEFPKVLPRRCLRAKTDGKVIVGIAIVTGLKQGTLTNDDRGMHNLHSILKTPLITQ